MKAQTTVTRLNNTDAQMVKTFVENGLKAQGWCLGTELGTGGQGRAYSIFKKEDGGGSENMTSADKRRVIKFAKKEGATQSLH